MSTKTDNNISGINLAKVFLTILVILGHICRLYGIETTATPMIDSKNAARLCRVIYSFHMPAFIFISGFIYSYLRIYCKKYSGPIHFIRNKCQRLLIPFVSISILWMYPIMRLLRIWDYSFFDWFFHTFLTLKDTYHLWFLIVLFILFAIRRLLEALIPSNKTHLLPLLLPLLFILSIVGATINLPFPFPSVLIYLFYFELGCFAGSKKNIFFSFTDNTFTLIIAPCLFLLLFLMHQLSATFLNELIPRILYPICATAGIIALFSICRKIESRTHIESKRIFNRILRNSYGIYLFHPMIIYTIYTLLQNTPIPPSILILCTLTLSSFMSYYITEALRYLHLRWLIGE